MYANCPGSDTTWNITRTPNSTRRKMRRPAKASCSLFTHRLSLTTYRLSIAPRHDGLICDPAGMPPKAVRSTPGGPEVPAALVGRQLLGGQAQGGTRHCRGLGTQERRQRVG